ncbi:hypothetical protein ZOSMA_72G00620 [Zostera marina]|uniref:Uncharacterized protein n=1 Tax=Zostera marina TaxID=29655 RepID=A0A0K9NQ55_ZOSMR|nr:hypothetical protein ZOSMA_72G00620 [Zostera marina]
MKVPLQSLLENKMTKYRMQVAFWNLLFGLLQSSFRSFNKCNFDGWFAIKSISGAIRFLAKILLSS